MHTRITSNLVGFVHLVNVGNPGAGRHRHRARYLGRLGRACRLVAWWAMPLAELISAHVMAAPIIHTDDTPIAALAPGNGRTRTGRLWALWLTSAPGKVRSRRLLSLERR
jgi:hypothetical protein